MALPLLNDTPKYELTVPSSKQKLNIARIWLKKKKFFSWQTNLVIGNRLLEQLQIRYMPALMMRLMLVN